MYNIVSQPAAGAARFTFLHGGSGGQSPPANFINFSVDIPPLVFWKIDKQGGGISVVIWTDIHPAVWNFCIESSIDNFHEIGGSG